MLDNNISFYLSTIPETSKDFPIAGLEQTAPQLSTIPKRLINISA